MKIIFAGSSDFSVIILKRLLKSEHEIIAALTQPDKPKGRNQRIQPSPVKMLAEAENIKVLQPERLRDEAFQAELKVLAPDVIVVAAYGKILPDWMLEFSPHGCINVHASLLPKYRGAAPIRRALMNGEEKTGATIMLVEPDLDTGPVFAEAIVEILPEDDAQTLSDRIAESGGEALLEVLKGIESSGLQPNRQDDAQATYADKVEKNEYWISWESRAQDIHNKIRALSPTPGARTMIDAGTMLKIIKAGVIETFDDSAPGTVLQAGPSLIIRAADNALELIEVQPENRLRMSAESFINGHKLVAGTRLA